MELTDCTEGLIVKTDFLQLKEKEELASLSYAKIQLWNVMLKQAFSS